METYTKIKHCNVHGDITFVLRADGRWRCKKCAVEAVQRRRDKIKQMAVAYKGGKCQVCGYDTYIGALEFHHLNPQEKDFGISAQGYTRSWESIKTEINKCVLVCSNCHKEIYAGLINPNNLEVINIEPEVMAKEPTKKPTKESKRPSKEILEDLIFKNSFEAIGRQFGVSGKAVTKWCIYYNLPSTRKEINQIVNQGVTSSSLV